MATDNALPFNMNPESLNHWLDSLSRLPPPQAAHSLSLALKQFKVEGYEAEASLTLLYNLTPLTLHFSASLAALANPENGPSEKTLKLAKLSMQLPRQLALIFCRVMDIHLLQSAQQQNCIYYALQLIGYSLRYYALFYEMPSATVWNRSAKLYKAAAASGALDLPQTPKINDFKALTSIGAVLKRNLLFTILSPTLYKPDEINQFFQLTSQFADLLEINTVCETVCTGFYWDLDKDYPPYPVKKSSARLPSGYMLINSQRISDKLESGELATNLSPTLHNKLELSLSGYRQIFESVVPGPPSRMTLVPGFAVACHYLQELSKLAKISQLSAQSRGSTQNIRTLSLIPLEHQRNVFDNADTPFNKPTFEGKTVNMLKTPNKHYSIAESRTINCATGDMVLLYKNQYPVSVAVIRQQQFNEISNTQQVLLELIADNCAIYNLAGGLIDTFAIVTNEDSDDAEVFLSSGRYNLFAPLALATGKSLTLTACLESNSFFARFKVR